MQLHSDHTRIRFAAYHGIGMKRLLPKLTQRMQPFKEDAKALSVPRFTLPVPQEDNETISHLYEPGNARMTLMFEAFVGPPQIVRLFGHGARPAAPRPRVRPR